MTESFKISFDSIFSSNGLQKFCTDEIRDKFFALTEIMLRENEVMNLTAITDEREIICKHYADSLLACDLFPENARVADIGCGAGFPTFPLAIARPDLKIVAIDSTAKRIDYVNRTAEALGLNNVSGVCMRAEDGAKRREFRESFDIACARAVAKIRVLTELCVPYLKVNGAFIAMKAKGAREELAEAGNAVALLQCKKEAVIERELLGAQDAEPLSRCFVVLRKLKLTPDKYPRNNSQIAKKPL